MIIKGIPPLFFILCGLTIAGVLAIAIISWHIDNYGIGTRPERLTLTQVEYLDVEKACRSGGLNGHVPNEIKL